MSLFYYKTRDGRLRRLVIKEQHECSKDKMSNTETV